MKEVLKAKMELTMMGVMVNVNNEELHDALDYINKTLFGVHAINNVEDIANVVEKMDSRKVTNLAVNKIYGDTVVTIIFEDKYNKSITQQDGVFCYVYNMNAPYFSEYGYSYFKRSENGLINRVG